MVAIKLVISIVSDKDASHLLNELVQKGYRTTKLASTGGFLREGNTTMLIGVEKERVDDVISIISTICQSRKQIVTPISSLPGPAEPFAAYPMEITVGGATVFVIDVEQNIKV